eukprot:Platyproteum_vivax@DN5138_c0_g1_i1.p1
MGNNPTILSLKKSHWKNGCTVIVTGASSGIGRELALRYAMRGCSLVLAARNQWKLQEIKDICLKYTDKCIDVATDVRHEQDCQRLIDVAVEAYGGLDLLVLNAGVTSHFEFNEFVDLNVYRYLLETNYFGYIACVKHAWQHLRKSKGQILVISSLSGEIGLPFRSAYCSSKFAVTGFFESLRMEQKDAEIAITLACPPSVPTSLRQNAVTPKLPRSFSSEDDFDVLTEKEKSLGLSLDEEKAAEPNGNMMSLEECVSIIMLAADKRARKVMFPVTAYLAVYLRPLLPDVVDPLIRKAAKL